MNKIRDFLGMSKEQYDWNEYDSTITFLSIFFYMAIAAAPFVISSESNLKENINGNKITALILLILSLYSFISFIVISVKINKKSL